jgi:hypothetical protein
MRRGWSDALSARTITSTLAPLGCKAKKRKGDERRDDATPSPTNIGSGNGTSQVLGSLWGAQNQVDPNTRHMQTMLAEVCRQSNQTAKTMGQPLWDKENARGCTHNCAWIKTPHPS